MTGERVYFVPKIADPEHPTLAELRDGVEITEYAYPIGTDDAPKPGPTFGSPPPQRPATAGPKRFEDDIPPPANRAERRARRRRRGL